MASDAAVAGIDKAAGIARQAAYSRVLTADVDEAAESIGRIFCPHALDPLFPGPISTRFTTARR